MSSINPYNIDASSSNWEISDLAAIYIYVAIVFLVFGYAIYMYIKERGICSRDTSLEFDSIEDIPLSTSITTESIRENRAGRPLITHITTESIPENRVDTPISTPITTEFTPAPPYSEIDILDVPPSYESLFPKQDQA